MHPQSPPSRFRRVRAAWQGAKRRWRWSLLNRKLRRFSEGAEFISAVVKIVWATDWLMNGAPVARTLLTKFVGDYHPSAAMVLWAVGLVHLFVVLQDDVLVRTWRLLAVRKCCASVGFVWWLAASVAYDSINFQLTSILTGLLATLLFYAVARED